MTDQLTPQDKRTEQPLPPPRRSERVKSEIMAGGAVTELDDDELAALPPDIANHGKIILQPPESTDQVVAGNLDFVVLIGDLQLVVSVELQGIE